MENKEPVKSAETAATQKPVQPQKPVKAPKPAKSKEKTIMIIAIILAVVMFFVVILSLFTKGFTNNPFKKDDGAPTCDCEYCSQMFKYYNYLIESGQIELKDVDGAYSDFDDFSNGDDSGVINQDDNSQSGNQNNSQGNSQTSSDPSKWTTAQIVEAYKHAAKKTHPTAQSYQSMTLRDGSLKAPGIDDWLVDFSEGIMKKALANNTKPIDGITGGHQNLQVSDVKSARAYKSGNNIVIEMLMKEQIDNGAADMYSGTVGHAISVVGDIDTVIDQFSGLGMKGSIADSDCKLHYKNPIVKVTLDQNGRIINGTWSYYTDITLNNLTVSAIGMTVPVKQATAIVDFAVTYNGGFKG